MTSQTHKSSGEPEGQSGDGQKEVSNCGSIIGRGILCSLAM